MNTLAYSTLIAFVSSLFTMFGVVWLLPSPAHSQSSNRIISLDELARHDHADSCWKAIEGQVYDISDYIDDHPTPPAVLIEWCGKESTDAWHDKGYGRAHSAAASALLADFKIGILAGSDSKPNTADSQKSEDVVDYSSSITHMDEQSVFQDGGYYAESAPDSRGWRGVVEIAVKNGRIVAVQYDEIKRDEEGNYLLRKSDDLNYADRWRRVSQISHLSAFAGYESQLMQTGDIDQVDALSGATSSYESFDALVREALKAARVE